MSRDGSGNYTLPVGNPVVSGTIIDVNWANPTMADIAQQLNNVVTRDGVLGPLVPIPMPNGTQALPGMSFKLAPGTGLWREAAKAGYSCHGVAAWYTDSTGLVVPSNITVNSVNTGPLAGFKNRIINGGFDVAQRGTSFAVPALVAYTLDRWAAYNSAAGRTISRQAGFSGAQYCARVQRDNGNAVTFTFGLFQPIESLNCYALQGKTAILTLSARVGAGSTDIPAVYVFSGTTADQGAAAHLGGWAGQTTLGGGALTGISTTAQEFSFPVTVPSNCLELGVLVYTAYVGTAGAADYFEVTNVRLEPGSVTTPFENRPYQIEENLCKRYGFRLNDSSSAYSVIAVGYGSTATAATMFIPAPVGLRIKPSAISFTAAGLELVDPATGAAQTVTAMTIVFYTGGLLAVYCSVAAGLTAGKTYALRQSNNTAAFIDIFVEL